MVKTVLKTAGMILGLAAIFFVALWFWEKQKKTAEAPVTVSPEPEIIVTAKPEPAFPAVTELDVRKTERGATIMVREVSTEPTIEKSDNPKKFYFVISGSKLELASPRLDKPHELVDEVVATLSMTDGTPSVRVDVETNKDSELSSRLVGSTFYLDITPKAVVKKKAPAKPKMVAKKKPVPIKKKPIVKATPKPRKIVRKPKPTPRPTPEPADNLLDELMAESDIQPDLEPIEEVDEEIAGDPAMEDIPLAEEGLDLDQLLEESEAQFEDAPVDMPRIASIPDGGTFSTSNIGGNLPTITDLNVRSEGGVTTVRMGMKKGIQVRIFRMRNPSRVTVDLVGAKNGLKKTYDSFAGTKVKKITTEQFSGPDGTISRVMIYVNGSPRYKKSADGSTLVLKLP